MTRQPSIGPVFSGCLNCPPKPEAPPMDWHPHPGFGLLRLERDGEVADGWDEFCDWPPREVYVSGSFEIPTKDGGTKTVAYAEYERVRPEEEVTLGEIEEACAADPEHDWRLRVEGPLGGAVYQRHGPEAWHPIERLDGFA